VVLDALGEDEDRLNIASKHLDSPVKSVELP
jgi:hypothetical protein